MNGNGVLIVIVYEPDVPVTPTTTAEQSVQLTGLNQEIWVTPAVGAVVALTVNTVELVMLVTITGAVPAMLLGHGVPSSQPPPGPAGDAVGDAGRSNRMHTSVGESTTLHPCP
jgi:hypothetical protein